MRLFVTLLAGFALAGPLRAENQPAKPNTLTPQEVADGWLLLFDGETTFGWKIDGTAKVKDGFLVLGEGQQTLAETTTGFQDFEIQVELEQKGHGAKIVISRGDGDYSHQIPADLGEKIRIQNRHNGFLDAVIERWTDGGWKPFLRPDLRAKKGISFLRFEIPAGTTVRCRNIKLKPSITHKPEAMQSLFNGKDLTGWRKYSGDAARSKSLFTVTPEGWLNVKDGPGDLQTEGQWADFVLQLECISNGPHLNSGVFFRCLPKQYQQGYEAQIRNQWEGNDRTKPVDYGTGAIYRRQPARKVVSSDHEWFTMTVVAHGNHIATWVNGYQVTDFTDTRPANENARNGSKTGPGCLSIQGHDPTTDLSFRDIRIAELAGGKK
jgi:hypothetical protein